MKKDHELLYEGPDERSDDLQVGTFQAFLSDKRKIASALVVFILLLVAIYVLLPKIVGIDDTLDRIDEATWYWIVIAVGFNVAAFIAYVALFRGMIGGVDNPTLQRRLDTRASYQITMAGLAATRVFSAGGAGGIALTYWALRKASMPRRQAGIRMVAFLALQYSVYLVALVVFGILMRTGVLPGSNPVGGTIVPAAIAGGVLVLLLMVALIPGDVERRLIDFSRGYRRPTLAARLVRGPATLAAGIRTAIAWVRRPGQGALALAGSVGFWAANIGVLWAAFEAFGGDVPFAVLVQGFFLGMVANLIPSPAGGVGSVDAGMIGAFVLFDIPSNIVFPAVLTYRVIAFWLPIPPGIVAFFQLRKTVALWESDTSVSKVKA